MFKPLALALLCCASWALAEEKNPWISYPGTLGLPGNGKQIVLISGDEEYHSDKACQILGKVLAEKHGFSCTVLFAIDPATGQIDPTVRDNIPGMEHLKSADLCILTTRFRNLPDEQMQWFAEYINAAKPVLGLRTATHAFAIPADRKYAAYSFDAPPESGWEQGFGRQVLGETWIDHHGIHDVEGTRGIIVPEQKNHPIVQITFPIFGPTDVYRVRLPLPGDSVPLVLGEVLQDTTPNARAVEGEKNNPKMPIAWVKTYSSPIDPSRTGRVFTCTMGSAADLANDGVRQLLVRAAYWCCGMENQLDSKLEK